MTIIKSLETSPAVVSYEIIDFIIFKSGYFIKAAANIAGGLRLFIRITSM